MTLSLAPAAMTRGSSRWVLLVSLALNLFFVGLALSTALRPAETPTWDPDVFVRLTRLADTLPQTDAAILQRQIATDRARLAAAQAEYHHDRSEIRVALRQQPFDPAVLRDVMRRTRAARQNYDQILQNLFAEAATKMSSSGRLTMANWPSKRGTAIREH